ncbi:MAG TPA: R3H domain-containing nucleic acid-binding protein [Candidatus Paceibacterota bacterium]|nr:R3H domain-containing nucleic acid-binding protein [Candidatus Paceibacterota bacterium]
MSPEQLKTTVSQFLDHLGLSSETVTVSDGHRTVVAIQSPESELLIGPKGEHLRALNALARRVVEKQYGEAAANFLIDVNGYHEQQMEAVRANARMLAQRARLFKHEVEMPPMSSYERLVVHELFQNDPEIETRSEGEGKFRHIVLGFRGTKPVVS